LLGWATVASYLTVALLCWRWARLLRREAGNVNRVRQVLYCHGLAVVTLLLGLNKQLDIQTWLASIGRDLARAEGWYDERADVQVALILAFSVFALTGFALGTWWLRRDRDGTRVSLLGLFFLVLFLLIRALSFNKVDHWLGIDLGGFRVNHALELGGIGLIALGALLGLRATRRSRAADTDRSRESTRA
jgi:hypothetical protein